MKDQANWFITFQEEIEHARAARQKGNEGMARVCARRAAGAVIGEYFRLQNLPEASDSAYDRLRTLRKLPDLPPRVKEVAGHLVERVTPQHKLPFDADLIADAEWLRNQLLSIYTQKP